MKTPHATMWRTCIFLISFELRTGGSFGTFAKVKSGVKNIIDPTKNMKCIQNVCVIPLLCCRVSRLQLNCVTAFCDSGPVRQGGHYIIKHVTKHVHCKLAIKDKFVQTVEYSVLSTFFRNFLESRHPLPPSHPPHPFKWAQI